MARKAIDLHTNENSALYARDLLIGLRERSIDRDVSEFRWPWSKALMSPDSFWFRAQYLLAADDAHRQLRALQNDQGHEYRTAGEAATKAAKELALEIED